jgi:hypothetical protein
MADAELARKAGDQTVVRIAVKALKRSTKNFSGLAERSIPTARCKPSLGEPKSSAPSTLMVCALPSRKNQRNFAATPAIRTNPLAPHPNQSALTYRYDPY